MTSNSDRHARAVNGFRIAKETFEEQGVTVEASR